MKKLTRFVSGLYIFIIIAVSAAPLKAHTLPTIRINAGGSTYTDSQGRQWEADGHFNTGQAGATTTDPIAGTDDDTLYQSEHWTWEEHQGPLQYTFAVPDGQYQVRLHFAEIYGPTSQTGARVFDVSIQDNLVLDNLDIYNEVGAKTALVESFTAEASAGQLAVKFHDATANSPKISAIEIIGQAHEHLLPTIRVNAGGGAYTDSQGRQWEADGHFNTGQAGATTTQDIAGTDDDAIYQSEHWTWYEHQGPLQYTFDIPDGTYGVRLHFAEIYGPTSQVGARVFDVDVQNNTVLNDLDIYDEAGANTALVKSFQAEVTDGQLVVTFHEPSANNPKVSAIEIVGQDQHFAHAVAGEDQTVVDVDENGSQEVALDGSTSHTHAISESLASYRWARAGDTLATTPTANVALPVGTHTVTLTVTDTAGNIAADEVTIQVLEPGEADLVPRIDSLSPPSGPQGGGNQLTLTGYGFFYPTADTVVQIGSQQVTGNNLTITGTNKITLAVPAGSGNVNVTVVTPGGTSQAQPYTYDDSLPPVQFTKSTILSDIPSPTAMAFGPDGKLYVSTLDDGIWILTLDENYNVTATAKSNAIQEGETTDRVMLGIAFNPHDDPANPRLYISHSQLFHEGQAPYNGKVSVLSGPNLTVKEDLVTGLPVSNHDHAVNGMAFGPDGKMYIQVGSNTNAGVPDAGIGGLEETPLSAATLVADIEAPNFDGTITWNAGQQTGGDVQIFASGFRNPYDLVWHTNGNLYGTDNGPNTGFGPSSTSCSTEGPDPVAPDELNLIVEGGYYGHANRVRGASDPRQCIYHPASSPSSSGYTAPLTTFTSSTNGIEEYYANTFGGQMLGDLVAGRFAGALFRVQLSDDGQSVTSNETLADAGDLDVAIGPDGSILVARHWFHEIIRYAPDEPTPTGLRILSATQRRGPLAGGRTVTITGNNFGTSPTVQIDGNPCTIQSVTATRITCTTPAGATPGPKPVVVTTGSQTATLQNGYIYLNQ